MCSDVEGQPVALRWVFGKSLRGIFVLLDVNVILQSSSACRSHYPLGCHPGLFVVDRTGLGQLEQADGVLSLLVIAHSA